MANNNIDYIEKSRVMQISLICALALLLFSLTILFSNYKANADEVEPRKIDVGLHPRGIAYNNQSKLMYVVNSGINQCEGTSGSTTISLIDEQNNVVDTLGPFDQDCLTGIAFVPSAVPEAHNAMFVTTAGDDTVMIIAGTVLLYTIGVDDDPLGIVFNPVNNRVYTANFEDDDLSVFWGTNLQPEIEFDDNTGPLGIAANTDNGDIYVTNFGRNGNQPASVSVVDTTSGSYRTISEVGHFPWGIAYNPFNQKMYVTNPRLDGVRDERTDIVTPIDTLRLRVGLPIKVGDKPFGIAYNQDNHRMYVTNFGDDTVSIIDASQDRVIQTIGVGKAPSDIAYNPANKKMYVSDYNEERVSVIDPSPSIMRLQLGPQVTGDGQFSNITGTTVDNKGNIYVADPVNQRVQEFTKDGTLIATRNNTTPYAIAVDPSGNVYITDSSHHFVEKFGSDGNVTRWGTAGEGDGQFIHPEAIAVDPSGQFVYVADDNKRIQKFDSNGVFIKKWGTNGTGDGQFYADPQGIAVDSSGNVYVSDTFNFRIQKFQLTTGPCPTGTTQIVPGVCVTKKWGQQGTGDGEFALNSRDRGGPHGIAIDHKGNVYVADPGNNRIQKFSSDGSFIAKWGTAGTAEGQFNEPRGIAVDSLGDVYAADSGNHRVQVFVPPP